MSKAGFSINDLQAGAKKLNTVPEPAPSKAGAGDAKSDREAVVALEDLYTKYNGDLDKIFGELKADPSKAKKPHHRPKDAEEFARQYLAGFYSIIEGEDGDAAAADSKTSHK